MSKVRFEEETLERDLIPPAAIKAVAVFLLLVLILAAVARLTGVGSLSDPSTLGREAVETRSLVFVTDGGEGPMSVMDGESGALIVALGAGEGGFVRGAVRPLLRERVRAGGVVDEAPWILTRWSDGALTLSDPLSGVVVDLFAFGTTNAEAFAALLR
jgi:putative photosynthetic complex assembly protein